MRKLIYILPFIAASLATAQVVITRDNTNLAVHSSVGLDARSDRQAAALPEYSITNFTVHPYTSPPKEGSIVFSSNKNNGDNEDYYGYFYWDGTKWTKLLDANSFLSDADYSVPYFFTNFNSSNNTSYGAIIPAPFTSAGNTNDNVLSGMTQSYHIIGASEGSGYWTMMDSNFHPNFTFAKNADATVKVNAVLVKPGAGAFDFGIAMGVFVNDKLIGTKVYPFSSLSQYTYCARKKITLLAPVKIIGGTNNVVKIGFRVVGSNQFAYTSLGGTTPSDGSLHSSLKSARIYVGTAFTTSTGPNGTYCENTAFQSPVNITVYGVSSN